VSLHLRIALLLLIAPFHAAAGSDVLSPHGYGRVHFGMTVKEAEAATNQRTSNRYANTGCDYVTFKRYPGLRFMVEDGVLTRADARKGVRNSANVQIGMTLAKVKAMHPAVVIEQHKYDDEGHYLILNTENGRAAIVLEESGGRITDIRAGVKPAVEYVEGCL
jgi:hypothetical protein